MRFDLDAIPSLLRNLVLAPVYAFAWILAMTAMALVWLVAPFTVERDIK